MPVKVLGENTPVPLDDQIPAPVVQVPLRATVGLFEHTVWLMPALIVMVEV